MAANPLEFYLFRVTVHGIREKPLLERAAKLDDKPRILREAILERPTALYGRTSWHIGNSEEVDDWGYYFRLGRDRMMSVPKTDPQGNFIDMEAPVSPYTHALMDIRLEVCALAKRAALGPEPESFARALSRVLSASDAAQSRFVEIEAASIKEPSEFLSRLRRAKVIRKLWVVNLRPNPFDVERDFIAPTTRTMESLQADTVKTEWDGAQLCMNDSGAAEIIASTAATGGDAGAKIIEGEGTTAAIRVSLSDTRARFSAEIDLDQVKKTAASALELARRCYRRIRSGDGTPSDD